MDTHGRLGSDRLTINRVECAIGDRVVCLWNNTLLNVTNGTRGTIESVNPQTDAMVIATDRGDRIELTSRYLVAGHVRHAYALTGHSGQGVTVERAFVLATAEARLQEWGYVALSRARQDTHVYVTADARERESDAPDPDDRDPAHRFARTLEESAVERLAVDQHPMPSGPKHDTQAEIEPPTTTHAGQARLRLIQQQQLTVAKLRAEAERKLHDAERDLCHSGRLRRRRRKGEIRAEIVRARTIIQAADEKLAELTKPAQPNQQAEPPGRPSRTSSAKRHNHTRDQVATHGLGL